MLLHSGVMAFLPITYTARWETFVLLLLGGMGSDKEYKFINSGEHKNVQSWVLAMVMAMAMSMDIVGWVIYTVL